MFDSICRVIVDKLCGALNLINSLRHHMINGPLQDENQNIGHEFPKQICFSTQVSIPSFEFSLKFAVRIAKIFKLMFDIFGLIVSLYDRDW